MIWTKESKGITSTNMMFLMWSSISPKSGSAALISFVSFVGYCFQTSWLQIRGSDAMTCYRWYADRIPIYLNVYSVLTDVLLRIVSGPPAVQVNEK